MFRTGQKWKISSLLADYDVLINPRGKPIDIFMAEHGKTRGDFKRDDLATWHTCWGKDYRFGLIFEKNTENLAFSFHTIQFKSLRFQPDFQHLGMAFVPEKFRGSQILQVITDYLVDQENMHRKNMLACNTQWSQNFWRRATGQSDIGSCCYYISYYDVTDLRVAHVANPRGIRIEKVTSSTINDVIAYDEQIFPFDRKNFTKHQFSEGICRIAYDLNGKTVGIGNLSIFPKTGEIVIGPMYSDDQNVAQLLFVEILREFLESDDKKHFWRLQIRSNDQCRQSFEWIGPFLKVPLHRRHLSNLCYSIYPPKYFFDFSKVFVNSYPTNGPC